MTEPISFQSFDALENFLWHPHAHENFNEKCPLLLVELSGAALVAYDKSLNKNPQGKPTSAKLTEQLGSFPAVTVVALASPEGFDFALSDSTNQLLAAFDILLIDTPGAALPAKQLASPRPKTAWVTTESLQEAIANLTITVKASPQASMSLAQLLRASQALSVRDALMSESWVYSNLQSGAEFARWLQTSSAKPLLASITQSLPAINLASPVLVEEHGDTLRLVLNRPERRNAFNAGMRDALVEALRAARLSPPAGGIVLSGAGKAFCSGGDLDEFGTTPDPVTAHVVRSLRSTAWEIHLLRQHITVKLHGACVGAGIELPSFADRVISTPDAFFWLPEVRLGLVPGAGGTAGIPRRIGRHRTCWMALSNHRIDPPTALEWGLIDAIEEIEAT